jgi:YVTN family beta-propeller protein
MEKTKRGGSEWRPARCSRIDQIREIRGLRIFLFVQKIVSTRPGGGSQDARALSSLGVSPKSSTWPSSRRVTANERLVRPNEHRPIKTIFPKIFGNFAPKISQKNSEKDGNNVKTKSKIIGYIIRSGVAAVFFSLALAAISSALNLPKGSVTVSRLSDTDIVPRDSNTEFDGTVSVINTLNRIVTATIPTGHAGPQEVTVTSDGGRGPRLKCFSL